MPERKIAKGKRRAKPLMHAAKIGDHRFRRVLIGFVRDHSASETARVTGLSLNSVVAIFQKLRVYFWEIGLFTDIYDGQDPFKHSGNEPSFEKALLEYHFQRVREKNGLKSSAHGPDYHFAESHWRYHFQILMRERVHHDVHAMMFSHLIEIIRLCGPIGAKPSNRRAGTLAVLRQMDQRIAWLERNAPGFRGVAQRAELKSIRAL